MRSPRKEKRAPRTRASSHTSYHTHTRARPRDRAFTAAKPREALDVLRGGGQRDGVGERCHEKSGMTRSRGPKNWRLAADGECKSGAALFSYRVTTATQNTNNSTRASTADHAGVRQADTANRTPGR